MSIAIKSPLKGIRHDLFEAIQYEVRDGKTGKVRGLQLDAHFVFDWIVKDAWNHFAAWAPDLSIVNFYSSEDMFNDATSWLEYEKGGRIAIGRCLAYFVSKEMLPLCCVNPFDSNKLYMVIGQ